MTTPRIRRPRRPEGAPALEEYVLPADIVRATGFPLSTVYEVMDKVAALAGLDLSQRLTRSKQLPLRAWHLHAAAVLAPQAQESRADPERARTTRRPTPPRPVQRAQSTASDASPAVALTTPRRPRRAAA